MIYTIINEYVCLKQVWYIIMKINIITDYHHSNFRFILWWHHEKEKFHSYNLWYGNLLIAQWTNSHPFYVIDIYGVKKKFESVIWVTWWRHDFPFKSEVRLSLWIITLQYITTYYYLIMITLFYVNIMFNYNILCGYIVVSTNIS